MFAPSALDNLHRTRFLHLGQHGDRVQQVTGQKGNTPVYFAEICTADVNTHTHTHTHTRLTALCLGLPR